IVLLDPRRPGHERRWHPGEAVLRMADVVVVAKTDAASAAQIEQVEASAADLAPQAAIVRARSVIRLEPQAPLEGRRVVVIEDGPTITHGGLADGAGWRAAQAAGASIVAPRAFAVGSLAQTFARHPHIGHVLPAMGYSADELADLRASIVAC